jgi:hypothetical protein
MSNPIDTAKTGKALDVRTQLGTTNPVNCDMTTSVVIAALMNALARIDQLETRLNAIDGQPAL